ncbi:protein kinase [Microbacterium sp. ARD32]|uniref:protein kinase domain-containing protein n=1 Tax=Microbacterium sp. ARD32 TaxID=2962577 RepID=UPI002882385B|nr:protein kinase [Microbacterium sp. ARD32]MDT0158201.1 protein kinase [Microbacterium sp. ARD32]
MNSATTPEGMPTVREDTVRATVRESDIARLTVRENGAADRATMREGTAAPRPRQFRLPPALEAEYEHEADLSSGSQASVLLCRRRATNEQVAIKVYFATAGTVDPSAIEALADADPRHIAPSSFGSADDQQWEIMEYFPLRSLQEVMRQQRDPFPAEFVHAFVADAAAAISFLHGQGIVHRDLKPANILVRALNPVDIVLGDFGISARTDGSALLTVRGTWGYAAPEASYGRVSPKGDWFALGLIAFELLTGRHLLADAGSGVLPNDLVLRDAIGRGVFDLSGVGDRHWHLLFEGLLTRDAEHRWGAAQVGEWLDGGEPAVHRSADEATRPVTALGVQAFAFGDRAYADPVELTKAMAANWQEAGRRLSGRGRGDLIDLLASLGYARTDVDRLLSSSRPGLLLLAMQREFTPERAPTFRGVALDSATMSAAAQRASGGSIADGDWIRELREGGVLKALTLYQGDGQYAVAEEILHAWWEELDAEADSLQRRSTAYTVPAEMRASWEGRLLLASLDPSAVGKLVESAAEEVAEGGTPIWTSSLASRLREARSVQSAVPAAVVIRTFFPVIRGIERDRLNAEQQAQQERDRIAREADEERAREAAEQLKAARRADRRRLRSIAWRGFAIRIWAVVGCALLAGATSMLSGSGAIDDWETGLRGAIACAGPVLALSLVIAIWESERGRPTPFARNGLRSASLVCAAAALVPHVRIGASSLVPAHVWWIPVLVLAVGYVAAVLLDRLQTPVSRALTAEVKRGRSAGRWMWVPTGLVAVTALGHATSVVIAQFGWSIPLALSTAPFGGALEAYAVWMESWLPITIGDGAIGLFAATAAASLGLVAPGLSRDLEQRIPRSRRAVLAISAVLSGLIVITSPWQVAFAAVFAVVTVCAGLVMLVVVGVIGAIAG